MSVKISKNTFAMSNPPSITYFASIVGKKEGEGPMGHIFDKVENDSHFGQDSWEKAESEMQKRTVELLFEKADITPDDVDFMFAGDLLNQCTGTTYGLRDLNIPILIVYGACSTMAETLLLSAVMTDNNLGGKIVAVTSSHFGSAERQFRLPLSYGGQRTPTSQWTCTASGAALVTTERTAPYIRGVTIGKIVDLGITDANNMGAAMAPAAAYTITTFLKDTKTSPNDYDCIVTGDLGFVGSELLYELLEKEGINIRSKHMDCGKMMFDREKQDVHSGGSGCGCSASILCGHFLPMIKSGDIKDMLFIATGALMSTTASQQGESIPGIAHLIHISHEYRKGDDNG